MSIDTIQKGKKGETLAISYLTKNGHTIHACNYRFHRGEIDIIAQKQQTLLFIEVKVRSNLLFGYPETFVTPKQEESYHQAATHYIETHQWEGPIRFDIIAITPMKNEWTITHLKDAF